MSFDFENEFVVYFNVILTFNMSLNFRKYCYYNVFLTLL